MKPAVISLCDLTGNAVKPWAEAGFDCFCVDIQHSIRRDRIVQVGAGRIHYVWGDVRSWTPPRGYRPVFGMSFTECTHVAGSGARDWSKKRGFMLRDALEQFESARQAFEWAGVTYVQENSIGKFASIEHIGKPSHYFHPWQYAGWCEDDNYTKNTALWSSDDFVMPAQRPAPWLGKPDDRIHKAPPGDDRANFRSASPMGFWTAVFHANRPSGAQTQQAVE